MRSEGSPASMAGMKTGRKEKLPQRAGDGGSPVQASLAGNTSEPRPEQEEKVGKPYTGKKKTGKWSRTHGGPKLSYVFHIVNGMFYVL